MKVTKSQLKNLIKESVKSYVKKENLSLRIIDGKFAVIDI